MRRTVLAYALFVVLSACATAPPSSIYDMAPAAREVRSFSGTYCYDAAAVRRYLTSDSSLPIPLADMVSGTPVQVAHEGQVLTLRYQTTEGERSTAIDLTSGRTSGGRLILPDRGSNGGVRLGASRAKRATSIYRLQDDSLVLEYSWSETGLAFFLVPFTERGVLILPLRPGNCADN